MGKRKSDIPFKTYRVCEAAPEINALLTVLFRCAKDPNTLWEETSYRDQRVCYNDVMTGNVIFYREPPRVSGRSIDFSDHGYRIWRWNQSNSRLRLCLYIPFHEVAPLESACYELVVMKSGNRTVISYGDIKHSSLKLWQVQLFDINGIYRYTFQYCENGIAPGHGANVDTRSDRELIESTDDIDLCEFEEAFMKTISQRY